MSTVSNAASASLSNLRRGGVSASRQAVVLLAATGFMAICSHLAFPLPFSPVPITFQTFGVLLLGMLLGPSAGCAALTLYLLEGAAGLPVFAPTAVSGPLHLLGPTAGFLLAYPVSALLAGAGYRALRPRLGSFASAMLSGSFALLPIFFLGAIGFHLFTHASSQITLALSVLPFLPGEALKLLLVAGIMTSLRRSPSASAH